MDVALRDEVLKVLNKQGRLSLAPTLEAADLVLIVQASYAAYYHEERALPEAARPRSTPPPPRPFPLPWPDHSEPAPAPPLPEAPDNPFGRSGPSLSINKMIPDMPPNTRMSLLAVAVPASVYRRAPADVAALLAAQVWEGWDQVPIRKGVIGRLSADPLVRSFAKGRDEAFTPHGWPVVEIRRAPSGHVVCGTASPASASRSGAEDAAVAGSGDAADAASAAVVGGKRPVVARFATGVLAVAVPIIANDTTGAPVSDLQASDFRVFDNDTEQRVAHVLTPAEPLDIALVIDTSASVKPRIEDFKLAATAFLDTMRAEDRVLIATFNDRAYLACELTDDRQLARQAIVDARPGGVLTRLYDSVEAVISERLDRTGGRQAMVLITDAIDVGSGWSTADATVRRLQSSNVPLYVVRYDAGPDAGWTTAHAPWPEALGRKEFEATRLGDRASAFLSEALASGGQVVSASTPDAIMSGMKEIARELQRQYLISYYPSPVPTDGTYHRLRVEIARPGVTARARAGYRAR